MNARNSYLVAAALTCLAGSSISQPVAAATDGKSISPMACQPRGPGTTASELTYGPYGITNPGNTSESVVCPILADGDASWTTTPGASAYLRIYVRTGAGSGNVACSAFTGTAVVSANPTYAVSYGGYDYPPSTRYSFQLNLAENGGTYSTAPPVTLVCTLSPKTALGWIYLQENLATNTP